MAARRTRALLRIFPALEGRRITHAWGGPIDVSPSHIPQVGTLPGRAGPLRVRLHRQRRGAVHLAGRTLAALAPGRRTTLTRLPIVDADAGAWVPPEPLAWLGGSLVRSRDGAPRAHRGGRRARRTRSRARSARRRARWACTWRGSSTPPWATSSLAGSAAAASVPDELADRLPPGQYIEAGFPVLTAGPTPRVDTGEWSLRIDGMVGQEREWTWTQFHQLAQEDMPCDIHCVTKWSKLGTSFRGVSVDTLLEGVEPSGRLRDGLLLRRLHDQPGARGPDRRQGLGRDRARGQPLPREHGGPARLLVPHLYFWKSAKWVAGLRVMDHDEPGFWEAERLPQPWRPLEGRALLERTDAGRAARAGQLADRNGRAIKTETPHVKSFRLDLPMWMPHLPGQHYDVRLTAPDGYQRPALLLDRLVAARRGRGRADHRPARRTARCRPTSTTWSTRATRWRSAARSPPTSSGAASRRCCSWAAARASCR